ncbi:hypothetical protein FRC09_001401 [Ceratobasidium sp. 395]|nr:hypothetical protein FRC09_001401 [Ceratobasidium sp. 395]
MAAPNQYTDIQSEDASAGRRSGRSRKPAAKIAEQQNAREAEAKAAAVRAGKRRRHYSPSELREVVEKRLKASGGNSNDQITIHPSIPAPSQYQRAGVNHNFVNRIREVHENQPTSSHSHGLPSSNERTADSNLTPLGPASASHQHIARVGTPVQATSSRYPPALAGSVPFTRSHTPSWLPPDANASPSPQNRPVCMQPPNLSRLVRNPTLDDHIYDCIYDQEPRLSIIQGLDSRRLISISPDSATQSEASDDDLEPATTWRECRPLPRHIISATPLDTTPPEPQVVGSTGSPTDPPLIRSKPILPPNDNPESKTYGDGEGELLQPRRIVPRQPVDMAGMTAKGKRKARNQMRPKQAEYHPLEMEILHSATMRMAAVCCCTDPFLLPHLQTALAEECWDWARRFHKKRITHNKEMIELLKRNLLNQKTQYTNAAAELVKEHYRFTSKATVFEPSESNDKQASNLLLDDNFTFGNVATRDDPFCNELILALFLKIWFRDHSAKWFFYPEHSGALRKPGANSTSGQIRKALEHDSCAPETIESCPCSAACDWCSGCSQATGRFPEPVNKLANNM